MFGSGRDEARHKNFSMQPEVSKMGESLNEFNVNIANRNQVNSTAVSNNLYSKQRRLATGESIMKQQESQPSRLVPEKKLASTNMASIYRQ